MHFNMFVFNLHWYNVLFKRSSNKLNELKAFPFPFVQLFNFNRSSGEYRQISSGKVYPVRSSCGLQVYKTRSLNSVSDAGRALNQVESLSVKMANENNVFRLIDYDCIGFDLDNTLCRYKLSQMIKMEYNILAKYLVEVKGYDPEFLLQPVETDVDFLQKGLILDIAHGNVLQLGSGGYIQRATHGTRFLSDSELERYYGKERSWDVTTEFSENLLEGWNGPLSARIRSLLDYFDMPASLIFARLVDTVDKRNGKELELYDIWSDILEGIVNMYRRDKFDTNEGGYFSALKANPDLYINKCSQNVKNWLRKLKDSKLVFLITGSHVDFASLTAKHILGDEWQELFDFVVCYSRKPGFFTGRRPFFKLDGIVETDAVDAVELNLGSVYSQGNWQDLYHLLAQKTGLTHPKCLYFGDHLIQDVYTPSEYTKCDTVAVVEELDAEGMVNVVVNHADASLLVSQKWGSFFCDKRNDELYDSLWADVIKKYAKICIPSLDVLAVHPLDYEISIFNSKSVILPAGYFPSYPVSLHKQ